MVYGRYEPFTMGVQTTQKNIVFCSKPCLINEGYTPLQPEIYVIDQLMIIISITLLWQGIMIDHEENYITELCVTIYIYYRNEIEVVSQYYSSMMEYIYIYTGVGKCPILGILDIT